MAHSIQATAITDQPISSKSESVITPEQRTQRCAPSADRPEATLNEATWNSRIVRHLLVATGVAFAIFYFVTPPGWLTLGIGAMAAIGGLITCIGTMGLQILIDKKLHLRETLTFEFSSIGRLFYHDIHQIKLMDTEDAFIDKRPAAQKIKIF